MNNEYILKHIEKDRPFKTEKECINYYMDECWVKQDVASDLFYYKVIIDKAIEYIETKMNDRKGVVVLPTLLNILRGNDIENTTEDKNIEHLKLYPPFLECTDDRFEDVENKINEMIDYINSKGDN